MESEVTEKALSELLQNFSKKEIISAITKIEEKIGSMHEISTKDFSKFNALMKDYYSNIKQLSKSVLSVQEYIFGPGHIAMTRMKDDYWQKKEVFSKIVGVSHTLSDSFVLIQTLVERAVVPFNNLRQNVITVQYLLASAKLNLVCSPTSSDKKVLDNIAELEKFIIGFRKQIDEASEKLGSLSNSLQRIKKQGDFHYLVSVRPVESYTESSSRELRNFKVEEHFRPDMFDTLNRHVQTCFNDLNNVVTNLQYHDIIRQKIEHIQETQNAVIERIDGIDGKNAATGNESVEEQIKFLVGLPVVINVQVSQLMYINKDYQESIEKITSGLLNVGSELKVMSDFFDTISEELRDIVDHIMPEFGALKAQFDNLIEGSERHIDDIMAAFNRNEKCYDEVKELFVNIFHNERENRPLLDTVLNSLEEDGNQHNADIVKKIRAIASDIKFNSNMVIACFNKVTQQFGNIDILQEGVERVSMPPSCDEEVSVLRTEIINLSHEMKDGGERSYKLANDIVEATKNVEYYNYFKQSIDEIIELLNSLNANNSFAALKSNISNGSTELLEYMEGLYTMKSERDVYDTVLKRTDDEAGESGSQADEDDIEFF